MADSFSFRITKKGPKQARLGTITTRNGSIKTPAFVPVTTTATFKGLMTIDLPALGAQCALANTYHLHLRPGEGVIAKHGTGDLQGLHTFMHFNKPIFTDSGGFQAFSLGVNMEVGGGKLGLTDKKNRSEAEFVKRSNFAKVTDKGVYFKSIYDGTKHFMGPKESMKIQSKLGADVIMAFDECTSPFQDYEYHKNALMRTNDWAKKSLKYVDSKQALYGIIQGGKYEDLRKESAIFTKNLPFDGIAIGGSFGDSYGDSKERMAEVLDWVIPLLDDRPRHMLGIGGVDDIFECVERGIDTFDCVHPTRIGRRGNLYLWPESGGKRKNKWRTNIKNTKYRNDTKPLDATCDCPTCKNYSRAYLRHLYVNQEYTYNQLAIQHNLRFMFRLMEEIRKSLRDETFLEMKKKWLK